ncbi:MAG: hypothetical protein RLY93_01000 [Sumerlaeia bacterium]
MKQAMRTLWTVAFAAACALPLAAQDSGEYGRPDFANVIGGSAVPVAVTAFSGHAGAYATPGGGAASLPTDGTLRLESSAIAQPISSSIPYVGFDEEAIEKAAELLYYEDAPSGQKDDAAFRYKVLLYARDDTDGDGQPNREAPIRARTELIDQFWGPAERARAQQAEQVLVDALRFSPTNLSLQRALLDLFYDRGVAELQIAKLREDDLEEDRLASGVGKGEALPAGGIERFRAEIARLSDPETGVAAGYNEASACYLELLEYGFGVDVNTLDPAFPPGTPLGWYIFQKNVPDQDGYAAQTLIDGEVEYLPLTRKGGVPASYPILFSGYRDLVFLMTALEREAVALSNAARLTAPLIDFDADIDPDRDAAEALITEVEQRIYLEGRILLGSFPELENKGAPTMSGLDSAISEWERAILETTETKSIIQGERNPLGFQPDFLVLTTGFESRGQEFFNSYNTLATWVSEETEPPVRPLSVALADFLSAFELYDNYRGYEDQFAEDLRQSSREYERRAVDLVGAIPGDPGYNPANPPTGLIADQRRSIEIARNRIDLNRQRTRNLSKEIQNEINRRAKERQINASIRSVYIEYGNKRANLVEEISHWDAVQSGANAFVAALGPALVLAPLGPVGIAIGAVIGGASVGANVGAELAKGEKKAELERLEGLEKSRVNALEDDLLDNESKTRIKNMVLQFATLAYESRESQLIMYQEVVRLQQHYNELAAIESFFEEDQEAFASRYYADPVHQERSLGATLRARNTFREAQNWLFFTARALEYKWNEPFERTVGDRTWTIESLYTTSNARELTQMLVAMETYDGARSLGPGTGANTDIISIKNDVLAYRDSGSSLYPDPITGELVTPLQAFRRTLRTYMVERDNGDIDVVMPFQTNFSPSGSQFFLGPEFDNNGNLTAPGTWLDKIQWIKINAPGNHSGARTFINATLSDGGAQLIRTMDPGSIDPDEPDKIVGGVTPWSSRLWFTSDGGESFEFREKLSVPIRMELNFPSGDDTLTGAPENTFFRERSVANTSWTLEFRVFDADGSPGGLTLLDIDQLDDVEILINHRFTPRL